VKNIKALKPEKVNKKKATQCEKAKKNREKKASSEQKGEAIQNINCHRLMLWKNKTK
jgi:hypothetical protein